MIIPVRCFSCGKPLSHLWEGYKAGLAKGQKSKDVLDALGVERACCRSVFLSNVDLIKQVGQFER